MAALFRKAGLPCEVRGDIEAVLWEKLLVNVGINPLTALLRVKNGALPEIPPAWELAVAAAAETLAVARARGIELQCRPGNPPQGSLHRHRGQPLVHAPGCAKRPPTEIEALNAQVITRGESHDIPTPVNHFLTQLIRALELAQEKGGGGG